MSDLVDRSFTDAARDRRPQDLTRRILWCRQGTTMRETRRVEQMYLNQAPIGELYGGRSPAYHNMTNRVDMKGC